MSMGIAIFAAAIAATAPPAGNEDAVLQADQQFSVAVAANDTRAISKITAEDWQIIDGDGHIITRAAFLQVIDSGQLKHGELSSTEKKVRLYGNAALVTAHARSVGEFAGTAFSTDEISTDFWVRTKDGWQCVLTRLTTLKP